MRADLFTLRLFVALGEERSIARAAAREHVVPSAASKRLADLEAELRVALFHRHAKGVELTPAGVALLDRARDILTSLEATAREISEFAADGFAHIRLTANPSAMAQFLPDDLAAFAGAFPRTKVDVTERFSVDVVRAVAEGLADVGIYCAPVAPHGVRSVPYRRDELVLAVPSDHPLASRERVAFAEATDYDFIGFFPNLSVDSVFPALALRPTARIRVQIANFHATCAMAKAGLGIALVPLGSANPHFADGQLTCVHLTDGWARRQLQLCVRADGEIRPSAGEFLEFLSARAARHRG